MKMNQKGQTLIEYVLMVTIMAFISINLLKQIRDWMVDNPNSYLNETLASLDDVIGEGALKGSYRRFKITQ